MKNIEFPEMKSQHVKDEPRVPSAPEPRIEEVDDGWVPMYSGKSARGVGATPNAIIPVRMAGVLAWVATAFLAALAIGAFPSLGTAFFIMAALLVVPLARVRRTIARIAPARMAVPAAIVASVILGLVCAPRTTTKGSAVVSASDSGSVAQSEAGEESTSDLLASCQVEPKTVVLEYSKKTVDPMTLVKQPEDKRIELGTEDDASLDLTSLGTQTVAYTVHCDGEKKTQNVAFEVMDTHDPEIRILSKDVAVEQGGGYNPRDNVESVTDPVDGSLAFVETEPAKLANSKDGKVYESGWYTLEGDYDDNNPTKYFIVVNAVDIHGNKSTREFSVMVNAAPAPTPEPVPESEPAPAPVEQQVQAAPAPVTHDYILNTNTGKFHYPNCGDVKRMKESNKQPVNATREDVIAMGYVPCKNCHP